MRGGVFDAALFFVIFINGIALVKILHKLTSCRSSF